MYLGVKWCDFGICYKILQYDKKWEDRWKKIGKIQPIIKAASWVHGSVFLSVKFSRSKIFLIKGCGCGVFFPKYSACDAHLKHFALYLIISLKNLIHFTDDES